MRIGTLQVFDDIIVGSTTTWFSRAEFNAQIGRSDNYAVQACLASVSGTAPTLRVASQHSVDSQNWIATGVTEISAVSISSNATFAGYYPALVFAQPLAPFVRLAITMGGTTPQARLKLYVTCRQT